jgi:M6 family metalloprotease-like protein
MTLTQPDGKQIDCFASGDEYFNYYHDEHGNLIAPDPDTGYYVYALQDGDKYYLTPTIVGSVERSKASGVLRNISPLSLKLFVPGFRSPYEKVPARPNAQNQAVQTLPSDAPSLGPFNTVVIFIRFSDQSEFTTSATTYDNMFNSTQAGYNSMKNYFAEVSYSQVSLQSYFYPVPGATVVSYQDSQPRNYYSPYNASTNTIGYSSDSDRTTREHTLLKNAAEAVSSQVPGSLNLDMDGDGYIDGVIFVIRGTNDAWSSLLWPHAWALYSYNVSINGKRIWNYSFQIETMTGNSVLCHEMGHNMGYPDLYRYSNTTITPVGSWDIMSNNTTIPQHSGAYMKYKYTKWISTLPKITLSGFYTLEPLYSATNNIYRIDSPNSATEFYVLEFRKRNATFESAIPGEGLLIYRINTLAGGNANGPPDEIYIYRPGGTNTTTNGTISQANYNATVGRTAINDLTSPSGFLSNDTAGGLDISNISTVGNTISFYVNSYCSPVKLYGTFSYFATIQEGYDAASDSGIVETVALSFTENLLLSRNIPVTLQGGYDCNYSSNSNWSIIAGSVIISGGPVTMENIIIR